VMRLSSVHSRGAAFLIKIFFCTAYSAIDREEEKRQ
jgi:hypothetical protein